MLWTQEDIDALKAAIRTGALEVSYTGPPERRIRYQSLKEMRDLLASMVADVRGGGSRVRLARYSKGT